MNYFQKIENKNEWQNLLDRALFKTFFHLIEWEDFLEKRFNWLKFEHYLYKDELLLSFARYKISGKERLISHPFCEYGGPLPLKKEINGLEFKNGLFSNFKEAFKINFHPYLLRYFKSLGLKEPDSQRDAYFIENFQTLTRENLYQSFRKTTRNEIKKAKDFELLIEKRKSEAHLKFFYKIYIKNTKRHETIPYPLSFFKYFSHSKNSEIILAKHQNRIIAGSIFLFYDQFIHYFLNASDEKYRNFKVNYLILWKQMKTYLGRNYQVFDLGGTRRGSSLEIFKRGWAGTRYPIFELKNYPESKLKQSKLRKIFGILPSLVMEKVGSYFLKYKL